MGFTDKQSADDALEERATHGQTDGSLIQPDDYDTPASPPKTSDSFPIDHPMTDSELDSHEVYDEGLMSATDVDAHSEDDSKKQQILHEEN